MNPHVFRFPISDAGFRTGCQLLLKCVAPLCAALPLVLAAGNAMADDLQKALSGDTHRLTVKLSEFDKNWKRVKIQGTVNISGNVSVNVSGTAAQALSQNNNLLGASGSSRLYLTRGQIVVGAGKTWLVTYHMPSSSLDLGVLLQAAATKTPPATEPLTAETPLRLSLLEVEQLGILDDVEEFDMDREIAESGKAAETLKTILQAESAKQQASQPSKSAAKSEATRDATLERPEK